MDDLAATRTLRGIEYLPYEHRSLTDAGCRQNAAFNCRRHFKGALKARRAVVLEGDQTRWLPWTSRLSGATASSAAGLWRPTL
jgi:hypothetical protein